ncbi:hypothetical protein C1645_783317 [Glomus cerebriforme]|uniref:Uncharacterized protein n=1 Tax=Glomus cerebriforme TaxID=658196 RepID=A0A397SIV6_9GLOM|nr:hypothetical protein C1645_783317 [Glomus cerebriforme]
MGISLSWLPFVGLFYALNVEKESHCIYWLSSVKYFIKIKNGKHQQIEYRPFGVHTMKLNENNNDEIMTNIKQCTVKASVLERLSSLVSAYYIVVGSLAGISMVTGSVVCESWPYIPSLLSWTIPALCMRIFSGDQIVKDPNEVFEVPAEPNPNDMDNVENGDNRNQIIMDDISLEW